MMIRDSGLLFWATLYIGLISYSPTLCQVCFNTHVHI